MANKSLAWRGNKTTFYFDFLLGGRRPSLKYASNGELGLILGGFSRKIGVLGLVSLVVDTSNITCTG
jgi:hypothetical protein